MASGWSCRTERPLSRTSPARGGDPGQRRDGPARHDDTEACAAISADEAIELLVPIGQPAPLSNVAVIACLRGPDLSRGIVACRARTRRPATNRTALSRRAPAYCRCRPPQEPAAGRPGRCCPCRSYPRPRPPTHSWRPSRASEAIEPCSCHSFFFRRGSTGGSRSTSHSSGRPGRAGGRSRQRRPRTTPFPTFTSGVGLELAGITDVSEGSCHHWPCPHGGHLRAAPPRELPALQARRRRSARHLRRGTVPAGERRASTARRS